MGKTAFQTFINNGTFIPPGGVTSVTVTARASVVGVTEWCNVFRDQSGNQWAMGGDSNLTGMTGDGTSTPRSSPVLVLGGLSIIKAEGYDTNPVTLHYLTQNGQIWGAGSNGNGELGNNTATAKFSSPVQVVGNLVFNHMTACENSAGGGTCFGITDGRIMYSWGQGGNGALGDGTTTSKSSPAAVAGGLAWTSFAKRAGSVSTDGMSAIRSDGSGYAWGVNTQGQLGDGTTVAKSSPVAIAGGLTFAKLSLGSTNGGSLRMFGVTTSGAGYAWGNNADGSLGVGDTTSRSSPVLILGGLTFKEIYSAGSQGEVYGLTTSGALYAWGKNAFGQLGLGDVASRSSPVLVLGGLTWAKLSNFANYGGYAQSYVIGLTTAGIPYAWGGNTYGNLGNGNRTSQSSPTLVLGSLTAVDVGANVGGQTSRILTIDGIAYGMGHNIGGGIGDGTNGDKSSPVLVAGNLRFNTRDNLTNTVIQVVPGTSYAVNFRGVGTGSTFGITPIGNGDIVQVVVAYDQ